MELVGSSYGLALDQAMKQTSATQNGVEIKLLQSIRQLPASWWKLVPNDRCGYNYRTRPRIVGIPIEALLDGGAGVNSIAEEAVVGTINAARILGIGLNDPRFPVLYFERWPEEESVVGIAKGKNIQILGAALLRVELVEQG